MPKNGTYYFFGQERVEHIIHTETFQAQKVHNAINGFSKLAQFIRSAQVGISNTFANFSILKLAYAILKYVLLK